MSDILSVFTIKQIQEYLTIKAFIERNGIDIIDVAHIMEKRKNEIKDGIQKKEKCSDCGSSLEIYPIMTPKGKRNLFGYRKMTYCGKCQKETFS